MVKIAITGGSLNGNCGAEAMLVTTIKRLKELIPEAEFGIYTPYYKDDSFIWQNTTDIHLFNLSPVLLGFFIFPLSILAGLFKWIRLHLLRSLFPGSIRFLWGSMALIDLAGVSFIDTRIRFLPYNVLSIYPGFLLKIPVFKLAQAVGPFNRSINRILAKHCFNKCNHIFARGGNTFKNLHELSLKKNNYSLSGDVAFCHKNGDSITKENPELVREINMITTILNGTHKKVLGICPSSVIARKKNGEKYIAFIKQTIEHFLKKDYYVIVFPNATKEHKPKIWRNNDLPLIEKVKEFYSDKQDNLTFISGNLNTDDVKKIMNILDFVIVSRFHAMVFALSLEKPLFVIGWSHKYREVMKEFALDKYVVDFSSSDPEQNFTLIEKMMINNKEIKENIKIHLPQVYTQSYKQFEKILTIIKKQLYKG